jgi:hypothetical protein
VARSLSLAVLEVLHQTAILSQQEEWAVPLRSQAASAAQRPLQGLAIIQVEQAARSHGLLVLAVELQERRLEQILAASAALSRLLRVLAVWAMQLILQIRAASAVRLHFEQVQAVQQALVAEHA